MRLNGGHPEGGGAQRSPTEGSLAIARQFNCLGATAIPRLRIASLALPQDDTYGMPRFARAPSG
jgi:hypothetical protein